MLRLLSNKLFTSDHFMTSLLFILAMFPLYYGLPSLELCLIIFDKNLSSIRTSESIWWDTFLTLYSSDKNFLLVISNCFVAFSDATAARGTFIAESLLFLLRIWISRVTRHKTVFKLAFIFSWSSWDFC